MLATSKMYAPVTLGEIVSRRTWTAARTLNPLALSRTTSAANSKALRLEHGSLAPEEPTEWVPKGLFSTIDGANAARWAWILLGIGEEDEVMAYVDWFVAWARDKSNHVPALQAYWQRTSWNLAMALRNNKSFGAAAKLGDHGRRGPLAGSSPTPAPTRRAEKEILRTDGPHGTDDDIERRRRVKEAAVAAGAASVAEVAGAVAEAAAEKNRTTTEARRRSTAATAAGHRKATASTSSSGGLMVGAAAAAQPTRRDHGRTPAGRGGRR